MQQSLKVENTPQDTISESIDNLQIVPAKFKATIKNLARKGTRHSSSKTLCALRHIIKKDRKLKQNKSKI